MLAESDELVTDRWPLPTTPETMRTEQPCPFQWRPYRHDRRPCIIKRCWQLLASTELEH